MYEETEQPLETSPQGCLEEDVGSKHHNSSACILFLIQYIVRLLYTCSNSIGYSKAYSLDAVLNSTFKCTVETRPDQFISTFEAWSVETVFPAQWKRQNLLTEAT